MAILFVLILYIPVINFSVMLGGFMGWTSTKQWVSGSQIEHSTTVLLYSWQIQEQSSPSIAHLPLGS